jgi:hypothetical protein
MMEWTAYEQVFGSILVHERVDVGLAKVAYMLSDGKKKFRDFMPEWYRELTADAELARGMAMMKGLARADD